MKEKVMIIGDTHFSDTFKGTHKDYKSSSIRLMKHIVGLVEKEKPSKLVFAGDFIGVSEKNIRSRSFFLEVIRFLQELNNLTKGHVYTVYGNHDIGSYSVTDVSLLVELGLFRKEGYLDFVTSDGDANLRIHMVDFGLENDTLNMLKGGSNVVVGHNNFAFNHDSLYGGQAGVVLANHTVWEGVDLVISGHIHVPSYELVSGRIGGTPSNLFVLGSPARVSERIEGCWYVVFEEEGKSGQVAYEAREFGLWGVEEEFEPKVERSEDELEHSIRDKNLRLIIQELNESKLMRGSLEKQIENFPLVSKEVKERAKWVLERVRGA